MDGKVALITGASSGIGRATAKPFAAKGVSVALAARRKDELAALVAEIESGGGQATYLKGGRGGAIVNVGSVNSFLGFAGGAAYATSKHGQVGLTTSASAELAPQGIRVNIICPGLIDTPDGGFTMTL